VDDEVWLLRQAKERMEEELRQLERSVSDTVTVFTRPLSQAINSAYSHMPEVRPPAHPQHSSDHVTLS
jgi:hypothetical protein